MPNTKRYVVTAITLGLIAAVSAGAIGLTNLLTNKKIEQNKENQIDKGIAEIFGENSSRIDGKTIKKEQYTNYVYYVQIKGESNLQYAFRTEGSNTYGKVSLLVGFNSERQFKGISVITNEQSYAQTLVNNYINPLKDAKDKESALNDVECGATNGAKLIRKMVEDARKVINKGIV